MSSEDSGDLLREILSIIQRLGDDATIMRAEESLSDTDSVMTTPDPNTCHPAFTHSMDFVRKFDGDQVFITMVSKAHLMDEPGIFPDSTEIKKVLLTRKKAMGPAPFVGQPWNPAYYMWSIWVDDYGRYVAGDSKLVYKYG